MKNTFKKIIKTLAIIRAELFKRKFDFVVFTSLSIFVVAVSAYTIQSYGSRMKWSRSESFSYDEVSRDLSMNKIILSASKYGFDGDIDGALLVYDTAINKRGTDDYQKSILLIAKATLYFNIADYENALIYTRQAALNDENFSVYSFMAQIFEKQNKYYDAIDCYKKAIKLIDDNKPTAADDLQYFNYRIKHLGSYHE